MSNRNRIRTVIRDESHIAPYVERSLQTCPLRDNERVLQVYIDKWNDGPKQSNLKSLLYILNILLADVPHKNGKTYTHSYIEFNAAYDIYIAHSACYSNQIELIKKDKNMKKQFRDLILHPLYGLCIYIVQAPTASYIVLRPDNIDLADAFSLLVKRNGNENENTLTKEMLDQLFSVMDTEWDKKVLRYILAKFYSYREIYNLGMDDHAALRESIEVDSVLKQISLIDEEAVQNVTENLIHRKKRLSSRLRRCRTLLLEKRQKWTRTQIEERQEEVTDILDQRNCVSKLIEDVGTGQRKELLTRIRYEKKKLIHKKRLKLRKLGSGRKQMIDVEDEHFIAKSIEDKATAHGRRHDSVLYLNHRVKKKDLLKLINMHHTKRNLPHLKSVTSVYNRGQAKKKNSIQASRHLGMGLWCVKKAPKSEGKDNLLTHYCRAAKKNIIRKLCATDHEQVLIRSFDDKAYICPETSTGMASSRKQKVFMSADSSKQKRLPKYDFPTAMANVTPGTMLYMTKAVVYDENGTEKIVTQSQDVVCQIKPKFFVGSDASVWGSHLIENRHTEIVLHEETNNTVYSIPFRNWCVKLIDTLRSYCLQTLKSDVMLIDKFKEDARYRKYEEKKVSFLKVNCDQVSAALSAELSNIDVLESDKSVQTILDEIAEAASDIILVIVDDGATAVDIWNQQSKLMSLCEVILDSLDNINLPTLKNKVIDLCDAGPGVGLTNHAVFYRVCTEILVCRYDYYIRLHLAPGDSSNNEVERIQSSVGDAICDGGALQFNHFKRYADLTEDEIAEMTVSDHERYEWERMERNAFAVCEEVNARVHGASTVDGYMKSYVSKHLDELFFWDREFLKLFVDNNKTDGNINVKTPGSHYYSMLAEFGNKHIRKGEKFMEFVKNSCVTDGGNMCEVCQKNPPLHEQVECIPQPYPDIGTMRYLHVRDTPKDLDGKMREIDDFNPRVQLNRLIESADIDGKCIDKIESFSNKYIVTKEYVLQHLIDARNKKHLKNAKLQERAQKRTEEHSKSYEDYDWQGIIDSGNLKKQIVKTLDKYIEHHALNHLHGKKKPQKIEGIKLHFYKNIYSTIEEADENMDVETDCSLSGIDTDEGDDSDDEVLGTTKHYSDVEDDEESETWEDASLFRINRYGRHVGVPT